ncbi:MAG: chemotaxis protein CheW [Desulfobacterales bacterium]|nr:chemotaxis protein CheW [Desulfobacterales bacterium]
MTDQPAEKNSEIHKTRKYELSELLQLINDELAAGLRDQDDEPQTAQENEERRELGRYICIELFGRQLAIPLSSVLEAGELQQVQSLPLLPSWLTGITNIRGEIVSVVNFALFLDHKNQSSSKAQSFLVVHDDTLKIAITVDRVVGTRFLFSSPGTHQNVDTRSELDFYAGRAFYEEQGREIEIDLFDLNAFLSSQKLCDLTSV